MFVYILSLSICSHCPREPCEYTLVYTHLSLWLLLVVILYSFLRLLLCSSLSRVQLCNPMDCSPPGSSVLGILRARILEWLAVPFSRESSQPRGQTQISCIAGWFFTIWATREAQFLRLLCLCCYFNDPGYSERGFKVVNWLAFSFLNISLGCSWTWGQLECLVFSFSSFSSQSEKF